MLSTGFKVKIVKKKKSIKKSKFYKEILKLNIKKTSNPIKKKKKKSIFLRVCSELRPVGRGVRGDVRCLCLQGPQAQCQLCSLLDAGEDAEEQEERAAGGNVLSSGATNTTGREAQPEQRVF